MKSAGPRVWLAQHPLTSARQVASNTGGNQPVQDRLFCRVQFADGTQGFGEAAPHPRKGPDTGQLEMEVRKACAPWASPRLPDLLRLAVLDAAAHAEALPLWEFLAWPTPPEHGHRTLVTVGGTDPAAVCAEMDAVQPVGIKLKLIHPRNQWTFVREIHRAFPHRPMALELNGGWSWQEAATALAQLENKVPDLLWVEQPCPPNQMTRRLPTRLRVFADEAIGLPEFDLSCYDGLVLKPARLGLLGCARWAARARAQAKDVTLGCLRQSSLLTNASLNLGGFVTTTWVDLDAALYLQGDPFASTPLDRATGQIHLPPGPGLATEPGLPLAWTPLE